MAKLFKRDARGTQKKAGGTVRAYMAEGTDDRLCICIHGSAPAGGAYEYVLRLSDTEASKIKVVLDDFLRLGTDAK